MNMSLNEGIETMTHMLVEHQLDDVIIKTTRKDGYFNGMPVSGHVHEKDIPSIVSIYLEQCPSESFNHPVLIQAINQYFEDLEASYDVVEKHVEEHPDEVIWQNGKHRVTCAQLSPDDLEDIAKYYFLAHASNVKQALDEFSQLFLD